MKFKNNNYLKTNYNLYLIYSNIKYLKSNNKFIWVAYENYFWWKYYPIINNYINIINTFKNKLTNVKNEIKKINLNDYKIRWYKFDNYEDEYIAKVYF